MPHGGITDGCYWVLPDRFMAGPSPGVRTKLRTSEGLVALLQLGITTFVDLTPEWEYGLEPYSQLLREQANGMGMAASHTRFPIGDRSLPANTLMVSILDHVDAALGDGRKVYLHCHAGIGRTGSVVGCYLVRHGMTGQKALAHIRSLRYGIVGSEHESPETPDQTRMVLSWRE